MQTMQTATSALAACTFVIASAGLVCVLRDAITLTAAGVEFLLKLVFRPARPVRAARGNVGGR